MRKLAPVVALLLSSGVAAEEWSCRLDETVERSAAFAALQRESLRYVFWEGNPLPPTPTEGERRALEERLLREGGVHEIEFLTCVFGDNRELWVLATRDSDGDGVLDYRITDFGKFRANDPDVDEDGVINELDAAPYDGSVANVDVDGNGIPDHIDWAHDAEKSAETRRIQRELFERFRVILVERSAEFTQRLARTVYDVLTRVYRARLTGPSDIPALRTIATERWYQLDQHTDEADENTPAIVIGQTATIVFYQHAIDFPPLDQIGTVAHEVAHNLQFSMDYTDADLREMRRWNLYRARNFYQFATRFGWTTEEVEIDPRERYELVLPDNDEWAPSPYEFAFRGRSPEDWTVILQAVGGEDPLTNPAIRAAHIIGTYSLSNAWEWHADHVSAYLYIGMEDRLKASGRYDPEFLRELREKVDRYGRNCWVFDHGNARGDRATLDHFEATLPVTSEDWDYLATHYMLADDFEACPR